MSEESNNPTGTALSAEQADEAIAAILFNEEDREPATPSNSVGETPSEDGDETREEHPENPDSEGGERLKEDVEPEPVEAPSYTDDTEIEVAPGERVKVKDLKSGYLRQSDYTRKTQELAQQREQIQGQLRNEYGNHLRTIEQNLLDHFPREPDWQQLAEDNPAMYAVEKEAWAKRLSDLAGVRQLRAQQEQYAIAQRDHAKAQAQSKAYDDLVVLHPEFAKTAEGKPSPVSSELVGFFLNEVGLPEQLLNEVDDARVFSILYDAMRYRRGEAQKSKTLQSIANKPGLTRPGTTQSKSSAADADYQKQRALLRRTGDSKHADSLIAGILFNDK